MIEKKFWRMEGISWSSIRVLFILMLVGVLMNAQSSITVSGSVKDENGEALSYASVYIQGKSGGITSNDYGFFSIEIPDTSVNLVVSFIGYAPIKIDLSKGNFSGIEVRLKPDLQKLDDVNISVDKGQQEQRHNSTQMSSINIPMKRLMRIPSLGGETDILKVIQLMPGVQKGGEGGTDMFVRGGDADQNLVLLDEAAVYNLGHLFGFFSVFNADAIRDMTLIKGAFPAQYGGRLSSVLDIRMKEGSDQKLHGAGGIGLLSSRMTLEGPIGDKASFMISGRRTYIDQVMKAVNFQLPYYFYDLNAKLNYQLSEKDRLYLSAYLGNDVLSFSDVAENGDESPAEGKEEESPFDFGFTLGNTTATARWNHIYNDKLFSNLTLLTTNFSYDINGSFVGNSLFISSKILDLGGKWEFDHYLNSKWKLKYGLSVINHKFQPNIISTQGDISNLISSSEARKTNTLENGVFLQADYDLNVRWKLSGGFRLSGAFVPNKLYVGPEPRLSARYKINEKNNLKASYSRMMQYMHRVSSSTVALPTDLWYPVTESVKPQFSDQVAVGYSKYESKLKTTFTVEAYYKWLYNLTEYREGANLVLNDDFESELLQGTGKSWGLEFLAKKDEGKLNGWISYTLSYANRSFDGLNNGNTFWAKYDRRHNFNIVANYDISKKWSISAVWVYSSGARFTPLIGQYVMPDASLTTVEIIPIYAAKNSVSMSASHRMDINFVRKSIKDKRFKSEWHFGAYNVYNQATPYRIEVSLTENGYEYTQPGLFGFIPSIAYNFKF
jgi:hypothetical protein